MAKKTMRNMKNKCKCDCVKCMCHHHDHSGGAIYGLGFIGAAVYYIGNSATFWMGVVGFLKAIVWPAFLVFGMLKSLGI